VKKDGAAPGAVGSSSGSGLSASGDAAILPPRRRAVQAPGDTLPDHILDRLDAEGIRSLDDWRALGRRRFRIWGITRSMARKLDALAARQS
jgi:hypothetical protein